MQRSVLIHPIVPQLLPEHQETFAADSASKPPPGPVFDYPATYVGQSGPKKSVQLYSATALGQQGIDLAQAILKGPSSGGWLQDTYDQVDAWFGHPWLAPTIMTPMNVVIAPLSSDHSGNGGAYHYSCYGINIYADACFANPALTHALMIAEIVECFEAVQNKGWDCGASNGEGLSRLMPEIMFPGVLDGYSSAAGWLDSDRPNWVDHTNPSDGDFASIGCTMVFLFWLRTVKKKNPGQIAWAAGPTLAVTGQKLLGGPRGKIWSKFIGDVNRKWPPGTPSGVTSDNCW